MTEQPKKPVGGAYGQFLAEKRPEFMKELKGQKASEVSKLAGERWKTVSEAEKAKYQKKYEGLKAQFDKDMESFLASGGVKRARKSKGDGKRRKKDANAPKKPAGGAYGRYLNAKRPEFTQELSHLSQKERFLGVTKLAGERWKKLSAEEKAPYEKEYQAAQKEYLKALAEYKASGGGADEDEEEDGEEDEEDEEEEEAAPAPKRRAAGA